MGHHTPGLYKYTKTLGLLLRSDFLATLIFSSFDLPGIDCRHDACDTFTGCGSNKFAKLDNTVHYDWVERFQLDLRRGIRYLRMKVDPGAARMYPVSYVGYSSGSAPRGWGGWLLLRSWRPRAFRRPTRPTQSSQFPTGWPFSLPGSLRIIRYT